MNYKKFKFLLLTFLIVAFTFTSCKNEDAIIDVPDNTEQSASIKRAMSELSTHFNQDGSLNPGENPVGNIIFDFCFEFVYPITLSYNNGTEVTVNDQDELITVLTSMTDDLYIDGISFPFQVETIVNGSVEIQTINNEGEFILLLASCGIDDDCECTDVYEPVCVEISNPNDEPFIIEFPNYCYAECEGFTQQDMVDCNPTGNDCEDDCPTAGNPVCVRVGDVIVTYANTCLAECAGYTQGDFEDCSNPGGNPDCQLDGGATVVLGDCIPGTNTYTITLVDVPSTAADHQSFELFSYDGVFLSSFTFGDLPITLTLTDQPNSETNSFNICIGSNDPHCCVEVDWIEPDCNPTTGDCEDNCPTAGNPVCVEVGDVIVTYANACLAECAGYTQGDYEDCNTNNGCWEFVYPISFTHNGETVTVENREEFDSTFNPGSSELLYPFQVEIEGTVIDILTPNYFFDLGEFERMCD